MKAATFLAILLFASVAKPALAEPLKLDLSVTRGKLRVLLINVSSQPINVNTRMSYGTLSEVTFLIRDAKGRPYNQLAVQKTFPSNPSDWQTLNPGQISGRDISLSDVGEFYGLRKGVHAITAHYTAERPGSPRIRLESNTVEFQSETDWIPRCIGTGPVVTVANSPNGKWHCAP